MVTVTNIDVALMNKLNDLGRRFGLEPWEFLAVYRSEDNSVTFESNPADSHISARHERMLAALGCGPDRKLPGETDEAMFAAIEGALGAAPKSWSR